MRFRRERILLGDSVTKQQVRRRQSVHDI